VAQAKNKLILPGVCRGRESVSATLQKEVTEMADKRKVEVFSAGCPVCDETVKIVQNIACPSCDVAVLDMNNPNVASRAKSLGVKSVPAVVIDGKLANCCSGRGPDQDTLKAAGLGQPIA
jgi:glutaredoxin 3